jgi:L,D-transpeptidase ErfK/SrfK
MSVRTWILATEYWRVTLLAVCLLAIAAVETNGEPTRMVAKAVPAAWESDAQLQTEHRRLLQEIQSRQAQRPYVVIDTQDNQVLLRQGDLTLHRAACASGSGRKLQGPRKWRPPWSFETPKGRFSVLRKVADPLWIKPEWAFVEEGSRIPVLAEDPRRFQRGVLGEYAIYFAPDFMIHGTLYEVNLGKSITHGCVRVSTDDLKFMYEQVEPGWAVYIY